MKKPLFIICLFVLIISFNPTVWSQTSLKEPLHGIVSMGMIDFHRYDGGVPDNSLNSLYAKPGVFDGVVINVAWAQLQPSPASFNTTAIDNALADVRNYNQQNTSKPLSVHLRVWPGPNAPLWIKNMDGQPVTVLHRNMPVTVGRFWSTSYRQAWRQLQQQLANKYDNEPLIHESL